MVMTGAGHRSQDPRLDQMFGRGVKRGVKPKRAEVERLALPIHESPSGYEED